MFKKILSTMLCIAITANLITANVFAMENTWENTQENEEIIKALQLIEPIKENYGLTDADLENMKVGEPIKTYEYTNDGIVFLRNYIPLICDGTLTAWAMENIDGENMSYQISTAYINEVNKLVDSAGEFALIYDANCCYLSNGVDFQKLGSYEEIGGRSILTKFALETSTLDLSDISKTHNLNYTNITTHGVVNPQTTYKCNVNYVPQNVNGYKNICWAATIACIVNYVKGTHYTALSFISDNPDFSSSNKDIGLELGKEVNILKKYGLNYTYMPSSIPPISNIAYNIRNDSPIYSAFKNEYGTFHICTIYGCTIDNQNNGAPICIYIVDPLYGYDIANYSASDYTYKYTNGSTGSHYVINYTTRRY